MRVDVLISGKRLRMWDSVVVGWMVRERDG